MSRHLLFRVIIAPLLFFGTNLLQATSVPAPKEDVNTLLVNLAARGTLTKPVLDDLIARGADVNKKNRLGVFALPAACAKGNINEVRLLLRKEYGVDVNAIFEGATSLTHAAAYGDNQCLQALLDAGADPDIVAVSGQWKGMDAESVARAQGYKQTAKLIAIAKKKRQEKKQGSKTFIETERAQAKRATQSEIKLINLASKDELTELLIHDLLKKGINIDAKNHDMNALLLAAEAGNLGTVKVLVKWGADVNIHGPSNLTPLLMAILGKHTKVVEFLLYAGADPNIAPTDGEWAGLDAAGIADRLGFTDIAKLIAEAKEKPRKQIAASLRRLKASADFHVLREAYEGTLNEKKLNNYLREGASVNATDVKGNFTAVILAIAKDHHDIVKLLLEYGADPNRQDIDGDTALIAAAEVGALLSTWVLLSHGADMTKKNAKGETALMVAQKQGHTAVAQMLREAETKPIKKPQMPQLSHEPSAEERKLVLNAQVIIHKYKSLLDEIRALISHPSLSLADILKTEKLFNQISVESVTTSDELKIITEFSDQFREKKREFIESKVQDPFATYTNHPSRAALKSALKLAKKSVGDLEALKMPELDETIKNMKERIASFEKQLTAEAPAKEPTEEEKAILQAAANLEAKNLAEASEVALSKNEFADVETKLRRIKNMTITDAQVQKQIAGLEDQYKKQKMAALQAQYEKALVAYKKKPTSEREQELRLIIKSLEDLKVPTLREFIRSAYQELKTIEKEKAVPAEEKKRISPTPAPEPQQLLFIFDPYNQLEPLPKEIKSRAEEALKELSLGYKNSSAVELKGKGLEGLWRIRVGNYRIVYKMLREKDAIAVVMIDARGEIYETEDEQLQKTRNADLIDIDVWQIDKLLEDAKSLLKGEDVSAAKAAYAESLLELYRWQLRGYPAGEEYLNSLLLSGKAAFKMNDLAKARERFADMIPQAIAFPKIKKQAEASMAEVDKRLASFQVGRRITPPSPARISPAPQEDIVGKLREEYQEARQLLVTNPEKATLELEQFSKESQPYAKELAQERRGADTVLNNEPLFSSAMDYLEDGEFDDAISSFNRYLKEIGDFVPKARKELILDKIEESKLGRTISRAAEKKLAKEEGRTHAT